MTSERKVMDQLRIECPEERETERLLWVSVAVLAVLFVVCLSVGGGFALTALCVAAMAPALFGSWSLFGAGKCDGSRGKEIEDVRANDEK